MVQLYRMLRLMHRGGLESRMFAKRSKVWIACLRSYDMFYRSPNHDGLIPVLLERGVSTSSCLPRSAFAADFAVRTLLGRHLLCSRRGFDTVAKPDGQAKALLHTARVHLSYSIVRASL